MAETFGLWEIAVGVLVKITFGDRVVWLLCEEHVRRLNIGRILVTW